MCLLADPAQVLAGPTSMYSNEILEWAVRMKILEARQHMVNMILATRRKRRLAI